MRAMQGTDAPAQTGRRMANNGPGKKDPGQKTPGRAGGVRGDEMAEAGKPERSSANALKQEKLVDDFFALLSKWYKKERTVTFYAGKMNRTPKYLSTAIKKMTGRSILEWINETVIIEIKMQLKTTDQTVAEISESLNFPDPSTFVQFFKHHTGLTPLQYRKQQ